MTDTEGGGLSETERERRRLAERAHDNATDFATRANEAAIRIGDNAMKALFVINGGAAVTLLAFIGQLAGGDIPRVQEHFVEITAPLSRFAIGLSVATAGMAFAYFTNFCIATQVHLTEWLYDYPYRKETPQSCWRGRLASVCRVLTIGAFVFSLWSFVAGINEIQDAVAKLGKLK